MKKIVTHGGQFHADEILAIAIVGKHKITVRSFPWNNWKPLYCVIPQKCPNKWGYQGSEFQDNGYKISNTGTTSTCIPKDWSDIK